MCLLPCNWAVSPTNATVYFTAPWLRTGAFISLVSDNGMWAGEAVCHAWVSGPQQAFASPFASLLSPRGELLLGSCYSLTWTQGRAHIAHQIQTATRCHAHPAGSETWCSAPVKPDLDRPILEDPHRSYQQNSLAEEFGSVSNFYMCIPEAETAICLLKSIFPLLAWARG